MVYVFMILSDVLLNYIIHFWVNLADKFNVNVTGMIRDHKICLKEPGYMALVLELVWGLQTLGLCLNTMQP